MSRSGESRLSVVDLEEQHRRYKEFMDEVERNPSLLEFPGQFEEILRGFLDSKIELADSRTPEVSADVERMKALYSNPRPFVILAPVPKEWWKDYPDRDPFKAENSFGVRYGMPERPFFVINNSRNIHWDCFFKLPDREPQSFRSSGAGNACGAYTLLNIIKRAGYKDDELVQRHLKAAKIPDLNGDVNELSVEQVKGFLKSVINNGREVIFSRPYIDREDIEKRIDKALERIDKPHKMLKSEDLTIGLMALGIDCVEATQFHKQHGEILENIKKNLLGLAEHRAEDYLREERDNLEKYLNERGFDEEQISSFFGFLNQKQRELLLLSSSLASDSPLNIRTTAPDSDFEVEEPAKKPRKSHRNKKAPLELETTPDEPQTLPQPSLQSEAPSTSEVGTDYKRSKNYRSVKMSLSRKEEVEEFKGRAYEAEGVKSFTNSAFQRIVKNNHEKYFREFKEQKKLIERKKKYHTDPASVDESSIIKAKFGGFFNVDGEGKMVIYEGEKIHEVNLKLTEMDKLIGAAQTQRKTIENLVMEGIRFVPVANRKKLLLFPQAESVITRRGGNIDVVFLSDEKGEFQHREQFFDTGRGYKMKAQLYGEEGGKFHNKDQVRRLSSKIYGSSNTSVTDDPWGDKKYDAKTAKSHFKVYAVKWDGGDVVNSVETHEPHKSWVIKFDPAVYLLTSAISGLVTGVSAVAEGLRAGKKPDPKPQRPIKAIALSSMLERSKGGGRGDMI